MSKGTKNKILECATQLIQTRGYNNTSLNEILTRSEVSKGNFFYYFKSKEELGFAVLDKLGKGFLDMLTQDVFTPDLKPVDQIYKMLDMEIAIFQKQGPNSGCPFGNLAAELSDFHEEFRKRIDYVFVTWANKIKEVLDKAKEEGTFSIDLDSHALSLFMISSMEGALILMKSSKEMASLEYTISELKNHLNALRKDMVPAMSE